MYIVIVGAGDVGTYLARILVEEGHDVAIVEADEALSRELEAELDALVVHGSGVNRAALMQAGIRRADLVIAATQVDEVNLVVCMAAARLGKPRTVARVRELHYYETDEALAAEEMGLSLIIGPERAMANRIVGLLSFEGTGEIRYLAGERMCLLELSLSSDSPLVHESLAELNSIFPTPSLVVGIDGTDGFRIPGGADVLCADDRADILTVPSNVDEFLILSGKPWHHVRHVLIIGGGTIGFQAAQALESQRIYPTIIEVDRQRAEWVARHLTKSIVLHGDGTDPQLLKEQLAEAADAVVVLVDDAEKAVLVGVFAKHLGAKKIIVRCDKLAYAPIAHKLGIDAIISPGRAVANAILHFVRRGQIESATMLGDHAAEVIELRIPAVPQNSALTETPLRDLEFPSGALVGGIIRGEEVVIASGKTILRPGDDVFVVALPSAIPEMEKLLS